MSAPIWDSTFTFAEFVTTLNYTQPSLYTLTYMIVTEEQRA